MKTTIERREFLGSAAAALARPAPEWRNRQPGMSYRRLGRTGFMISEVVMGGNGITGDTWEHVLMALDLGLNYLDTSPNYGRGKSEEGYRKVLAARPRDRFFLTTKIGQWGQNRNRLYREIFESLPAPEQKKLRAEANEELARRHALDEDYFGGYFTNQRDELDGAWLSNVMSKKYGHKIDREKNYKRIIFESLEGSLKRLGTDHVDIVMCPHGASSPFELLNHPEILEAFQTLKKQGKARHLGVSAHNDPAGILDAAVEAKVYSAAMVAYNIVNQRYVSRSLENARRQDLGVIAMKVARPVHNGRGTGRQDDPKRVKLIEDAVPGPLKVPQKAYVWALRNPNLSAVISEMLTAGHVRDNVGLVRREP